MTEDEFWSWIEDSRRTAGGALERQVDVLEQRLLAGSRETLLEFRDRWAEADARVFTWPIGDAANLLLGWVSDDFFENVRAWIISHGRATVDRVVADPDSLVDLAFDKAALEGDSAESLLFLTQTVWEEMTGDEAMPDGPDDVYSGTPTGERTDLKDRQAVHARFPRLAELIGYDELIASDGGDAGFAWFLQYDGVGPAVDVDRDQRVPDSVWHTYRRPS